MINDSEGTDGANHIGIKRYRYSCIGTVLDMNGREGKSGRKCEQVKVAPIRIEGNEVEVF